MELTTDEQWIIFQICYEIEIYFSIKRLKSIK